MLAYAHRLLELNDEAVAAVRSSQLEGLVRLGLPEDLGESVLSTVLGRFARAHPPARLCPSVPITAQTPSTSARARRA